VRLGRAQRRHALLRAERLPPLPPVPRRGQWRADGLAPPLLPAARAAHPPSLPRGGRGGGEPPLALAPRAPPRGAPPRLSPLPIPMPPFSDVWWSLATEVQFYAVLPLLALAFGRSRRVTFALLAIYAMAYAAVALFLPVPPFEPWLRAQSIIGRGPLFLFGIL